jgi:hypothetical protein
LLAGGAGAPISQPLQLSPVTHKTTKHRAKLNNGPSTLRGLASCGPALVG